jgi:hypothetical protein
MAKTARWLHIYLSMVSFAVILFFAVTGLTLNHPDWFSGSIKTREARGTIPASLLPTSGQPDKEAIVKAIRSKEHLHGAVEEVRVDDTEVSFSFRAPGYTADVVIERDKDTYTVTETRNGFVAVINDLHKGRDSGKVWGWLIDASAILLTLVSFTGLIILFFIYKRRTSGLLIAAAGSALCVLIYKIFVP